MYIMLAWGFFQIYVLGTPLQAESADFEMHSEHGEILGFALVFLVARAFSSGSAALTGVEAISNGVPAFRKPKSRNAATTLALLGGDRHHVVHGHHHAGQGNRRADRRAATRAIGRRSARLSPEDPHRPARRRGLPRLPDRALSDRRRHGVDPGAGRQHRLQRISRAGIDSGPGPFPAPAAAHPRRPAGVLQRHSVPGVRRCRVRRGVPRRGDRAHPALHRRGVRVVHAEPDRHGAALDPAVAHRDRACRARRR